VLVAGFPAGSWGTNCYLVAPGPGEQCVVVDPGHEAAAGVADLVREHGLQPVAVLLTHGHIDHTFSVVPVCGRYGVPAYIHPADRGQLADPGSGLGVASAEMFAGMEFAEPDDVVELTGHDTITLAGIDFTVDHAPGHTRGSVTFRVGADVMFSGDLLFQGSIGRTDLPGGSYDEILDSLVRVVLPLPDELPVMSGHGAATTIGAERATNPFLAEAIARAAGVSGAAPAAPSRGW
jgi:glyoxylase-like metal-dependent hydrolase (beta-lactamase superfamily II)